MEGLSREKEKKGSFFAKKEKESPRLWNDR